MSVAVASCSMADLFRGRTIKASDGSLIKGRLHLPEYQRPYRWGKAEVGRLLEDLRTYFELEDGQPSPEHPFFLGSIILHQQEDGGLLNIIDGQQRLTTLGLLAWLKKPGSEPALSFDSPISQQQICKNIHWLQQQERLRRLDLRQINIVLVVTRSEDDAYRFFETQNTGGIRLSGPDIIKAHHLRVTPQQSQDDFARLWEGMGDLNPLVEALLKARFWQVLYFRNFPSPHREPNQMRSAVVDELGDRTGAGKEDVAYRPLRVSFSEPGQAQHEEHTDGYAIRQPINAGVNTIHYLHFFESLRQQLLTKNIVKGLEPFHGFYHELICRVEGCGYIKQLYDSCLLTYVSHFGTEYLYETALWLFRAVYSPRVSNQKAVREASIGALVRETPIFDWILMSYTHKQCIERLKAFEYQVSPENLGPDENGVKRRFIEKVDQWFAMGIPTGEFARSYDESLKKGIDKKSGRVGVSNA